MFIMKIYSIIHLMKSNIIICADHDQAVVCKLNYIVLWGR